MRAQILAAALLAGCCARPAVDAGVADMGAVDSAPIMAADLACVPQFSRCLAPAMCCPSLECVGGACAKVSP